MSVIETLKQEFYYTHCEELTSNKSTKLVISSDWKAKTIGVDRVIVYLSGINPKTGELLRKDDFKYSFDAVRTRYDVGVVSLYGEYLIHCDAVLSDGEEVEDFIDPQVLVLNNSKDIPYIYYSFIPAPIGWVGFKIDTNCRVRCSGYLWIENDGHYQRLPLFRGDSMNCFIRAENKNQLEFINIKEKHLKPVER